MSTKLNLDDIASCNGLAARKLSRKITQLYDNALAPTGLRSTQIHILACLYRLRKTPPTLNALADALVLDRSGLGHNLRPLERDGLIAMQENILDRRERLLVLTDDGTAKLKEAFPYWSQAQETFNSLYGVDKMSELRQTLQLIAHDERLV